MVNSEQPVIESSENSEATTSNQNGIVNPLENQCNSTSSQQGRIWFSAVMLDDSSTTVTAPGDATSSSHESTTDGRNHLACHRRRQERVNRLLGVQGQWKDLKSQHGQWTCFICCHVRTGAIVIGFWHMLLHLMALSLIAVVMIHPEVLNQGHKEGFENEKQLEITRNGVQDVQAVNCSEMPCLLATQGDGRMRDATPDFPLTLGNILSANKLNKEDINVALFITPCTFIVTLLLVYGAFRGQPSHIMPFFFLQVFDFCISSMSMIGYLSYLPNVRQLISETPTFPFQRQLLAMNTKCLTFFVMLIFISSFMVKAYCISVVWRCYKYLMHRSQGVRWPGRGRMGHSGPVDQESQTLVIGQDLPDYDTAITDPQYRKKTSALFPEPPPSYDMAMAAYYTQQQILAEAQSRLANNGGTTTTTNDNSPLLEQVQTTDAVPEASSNSREDQAGPSSETVTN